MVLMCSNEKIDNLVFARPPSKPQKADIAVVVDGVLVVRLANGRFITSARDFHKWAFTIGHDLLMREPVVKGLAAIGYITAAEAAEHMAEHRRMKARRDREFAEKMVREYGDKLGIGAAVAQAMSTGTAKTPQAVEGRSPASAVPNGDAPDA